jgi:hypothetical protein
MNEELDNEDNLDIFNANFECDDKDQITDLYKMSKTIEDNDIIAKKIVKKKYNHPLFLNYNYCLFCLERRKTKYNHQNLYDIHEKIDIKKIGSFLKKNHIRLQLPKNKIEKLSKRRFIHSCEAIPKNIIENKPDNESDTELYIEKEKENDFNGSNNLLSFYNKFFNTPDSKLNKNSNSKYSKNMHKKSSKFLSLNMEINEFDEENLKSDKDNIKINKNEDKNSKKINNVKTYNRINSLSKKKIPQHTRTLSNDKDETDNIFSFHRGSESRAEQNKPTSIFGFINNYFRKATQEIEIKETNNELNDSEIRSFNYRDKNEKCSLCLDEIKDKFTLFCGDFFCRECIINLLKECIDNITLFDKMECPRCHDPINESTIKFLLNPEYIEKYNKIQTRINGLKDKKNIPCPHPDCEGFALKEEQINGTLECQNGHVFCLKCLEEIDHKFRLEPKNIHVCIQKYPETSKYLRSNKNIRKCPQCKSWVQRDPGGCNYFRCTNIWCKYEFCWICGSKYDPSHYRNPLSMCFRLDKSNYQGNLAKSMRIRRIRCILIVLLFVLILFPIICIFFSFFSIGAFIMYFQFDGKELRNVRLHSKVLHKIFYILYSLFYLCISIGLIPFGYICLVILILFIPILIIINKIRKKRTGDDF